MTQPIRPMLGDIELQQVQLIQLDEDQVLTRHDIPALEGDFLQRLGRAGAAIELTGVQSGPEAREGLNGLRAAFRAADPLTFSADIVTATELEDVLIERFEITEQAGLPDAFEFRLRLREYTEPTAPEPVTPPPPPPPPPVRQDEGVLVVTVIKEGDPGFDPSGVTVTVSGTTQAGEEFTDRPMTERDGNRWTGDPFPAGSYNVRANAPAAAADGSDLSGTAQATVRAGQTTEVTITLRDAAALALRFLVHFRFDSAFVEPCLKQVLRQVAGFAGDNGDMRFLCVGHTDLTGSEAYNQSLSERRARSVFSVLRFGNDRQAAIDEWNELRQTRTPGTTTSLRDSWGAREYQQMLQDRGFYQGRIDGDHGPLTDTAVRDFQTASGLPATGAMNGATWPVLIEAYLAAENLSVPDDRFLPNCPGEILKWLGCGELDPVRDVQFAWRPNRRTELLFTRATELPADVARPDTFDLPAPGAVAGGWCLNDSATGTRSCFVVPNPNSARHETCPGTLPRGEPLTRQPAEPAPSFVVQGSIRFEDGTPYTGEFFITAPDGEYMDGERPSSSGAGRAGTPFRRRPEPDGSFRYPDKPKTPGIFILELDADVVARNLGDPLDQAKGPVVCRRLAAPADRFDVIIVDRAVAGVIPSIEFPRLDGAAPSGDPTDNILVLKKPHTAPARRPVIFRAAPQFTGTGTVTIEQGADRIRLFDAPAGGNQITFDGSDNVFSDVALQSPGVTLFAEGGPNHSDALDDVIIKLALTVNASPGFSATHALTTVEFTLQIATSRPAAGVDPAFLSEADKIAVGRFTQVRDPLLGHERTIIRIDPPRPEAFAGDLTLNSIGTAAALFQVERPAAAQAALPLPHVIPRASIPAGGLQMFVEGLDHSAAVRDATLALGVRNLETDADQVRMTMVRVDIAENNLPATAAATVTRFGLWDQAYVTAGATAGELVADVVSNDARRFHLRVRDAGGPAGQTTINWRTLLANRVADDDAPASQALTLVESAAGSHQYISNGVMLVADDLDRATDTPSGLPADPARPEPRRPGQSDHRLRRARIDGFMRAEYRPPAQPATRLPITLPVFNRNPEERRRLAVRVVRYNSPGNANYRSATDAYIDAQFARANTLWNRVGLQIDRTGAIDDRDIPAAALDPATNLFPFDPIGPRERPVLQDLIPISPDNTLTVVFVHIVDTPGSPQAANAYAQILDVGNVPNPNAPPANLTMGDRFFVFVSTTLNLTDETLAHEIHHVVYNRFDAEARRRFFTLNTTPPGTFANAVAPPIALPSRRIYRRVQNLHSPDPDNDPAADNICNWHRRTRVGRYPSGGGLGAAVATTGNTLVTDF